MIRTIAAVTLAMCLAVHADCAEASQLFTLPITLPAGGVVVTSASPFPFTVEFPTAFASIDDIALSGTFSGDLWGHQEIWQYDFGGQINYFFTQRNDFDLHSIDPYAFNRMLDGREDLTFEMQPGSVRLASLEMRIIGTPVPEPNTYALAAIGVIGLLAFRRRTR